MSVSLIITLVLALGAEPSSGELKFSATELFEMGSAKLKTSSDEALNKVKQHLDAHPDVNKLRVEVHTDSLDVGNANQELSEKRAVALVDALVKVGVPCDRLIAVGFGGMRPIANNETAEGRTRNRRALFVDAVVNGQQVGKELDGGGKMVATCK